MEHLRTKRCMRRSRHATVSGQSRGQIVDAPLDPRKACRSGRSSGSRNWEGDLLSGANNSYIATLVERHSRFAMLVKVPGKDMNQRIGICSLGITHRDVGG
jgi:IS30 family transposase